MPIPSPDLTARNLQALAERWAPNTANERASFQSWMLDLLEALGAERPLPPIPDHQFELPVRVVDREGRESVNFIDYWKAGHVAVEAKALGGAAGDLGLRKAFGQVRNYVAHVPGTPPPYLMVVDVARTAIVWDRWSGAYGDFAAGRRIPLATLHERADDTRLLQDILIQPLVRDPRGRAQAVTREIAGKLAQLAASLEDRGPRRRAEAQTTTHLHFHDTPIHRLHRCPPEVWIYLLDAECRPYLPAKQGKVTPLGYAPGLAACRFVAAL